MVAIKETFCTINLQSITSYFFLFFFSSCAEIFRNILKFAGTFCQRIYGTEAASNEQLAIICPIIQNRETISIN